MVKWLNTPFDDVIQSAINIYGDKVNCEIEIGQGLQKEHEAYGETNWCEDGRVIVTLDADAPYVHIMETLAHELAHVVVGADHEHDEVWEKAFDNIFKEYDRYGKEKYKN